MTPAYFIFIDFDKYLMKDVVVCKCKSDDQLSLKASEIQNKYLYYQAKHKVFNKFFKNILNSQFCADIFEQKIIL